MNMVFLFSSPIVVFVFILHVLAVTSVDVVLEDDNESIIMTSIVTDVDYQNITGIRIRPLCVGDMSFPNTMFTIFPSNEGDGVTIETSPPNLVAVRTYISVSTLHEFGLAIVDPGLLGKHLDFEWNTNVSSTATSGGVRIGVPPDQLQDVWLYGGHNVQVFDGFNKVTYLRVEGDGSIIHASMTSSISTELKLLNNRGQMYVKTNVPVTTGSIYGGGQSWVETPSYNWIRVFDDGSELTIKGDVDVSNRGRVRDGAQLTVTGTITGTINSYNNSIVNAPSCDNVTSIDGSSICNAGPQNVDVNVGNLSQNSQILYGTYTCGGEDSSSSSLTPSDSASSVEMLLILSRIHLPLLLLMFI